MRCTATAGLHLLVFSAGLWTAFHPTLSSGFTRLQTDPGDTLLNHYILEHTWHWLTGQAGSESLWSPPCFHPAPGTLAYSENLLGTAPLYWLFRCGCDELLAYQLWMMGIIGLTYLSMTWTLRRFGVSHLMAALGGFVIAFGLPRVNQLGHQQLLPSLFSPPAVYAVWRFLETPSVRWLVAAVGWTFLQLLASVYLGWFLAVGLVVLGGVFLGTDAQSRKRLSEFLVGRWRPILVVAWATIVGLMVLFGPYLMTNNGFRRSYRWEVSLMLPRPASWLSPAPASAWADSLPTADGPLNHEHHLFPGAVFLMLMAAGAVVAAVRGGRVAAVLLITAAVLFVLSLKLGPWSVWRGVYAAVPGAKAVRAVTRIFTAVYLFGGIGALVALRGQWRPAVSAGLLALTIAESWQPRLPSFDPAPFFAEVDRLAGELHGAKAAYVEPDPESQFWVSGLAAQWAGLKAGVPVVNGYSGRTPRGYPDEKLILGRSELAGWTGRRFDDLRVVGPVRLAAAYPAPAIPADAPPALRALDFRPKRPVLRAENDTPCSTSPTRPLAPPASGPAGR